MKTSEKIKTFSLILLILLVVIAKLTSNCPRDRVWDEYELQVMSSEKE